MRLSIIISLALLALVACAPQEVVNYQRANALSRVMENIPLSFKSEGIWFSHPALALQIADQTQVYSVQEFFYLTEQEREDYIEAQSGVMLAQPTVLGNARSYPDEWQETFGFDHFEVDLSVTTGETMLAPHTPAYIEGNFDETIIRQKLLAFGYEEREAAGSIYYAKWLDNQVDLRESDNRMAMNLMNRVFVGNETLVTSPATKQMEDIMETLAGEQPSLAEYPAFAAISEALGDVVDAVVMTRSSALESDEAKAVIYEKPDNWGTLHKWEAVGFGRRITNDGGRRQFIALYYPDADTADEDAGELISRLNNYTSAVPLMYPEAKGLVAGSPKKPLSGCNFEVSRIDSTEDGSTLTVSCIRVDGGSHASLLPLVDLRDLGFLLP